MADQYNPYQITDPDRIAKIRQRMAGQEENPYRVTRPLGTDPMTGLPITGGQPIPRVADKPGMPAPPNMLPVYAPPGTPQPAGSPRNMPGTQPAGYVAGGYARGEQQPFVLTQQPGETFQQAMQRAARVGKTVSPQLIQQQAQAGIRGAPGVLAAAPAIGAGLPAFMATAGPHIPGLAAGMAGDWAIEKARELGMPGAQHIPKWLPWVIPSGEIGGTILGKTMSKYMGKGLAEAAEKIAVDKAAGRVVGGEEKELLKEQMAKVFSGEAKASELKAMSKELKAGKKAGEAAAQETEKALEQSKGLKGSMQQGGKVPSTGTYILHRGEQVLPNFSMASRGKTGDMFAGMGGGPRATTPMAQRQAYYGPTNAPGMIEAGNINLLDRPKVKNRDGTISTLRSMSIDDENGNSVLIPTIANGKFLSDRKAIEHYLKTGEHLGKFKDYMSADAHSWRLHMGQSQYYGTSEERTPLAPLGNFQQGGVVPQTGPYRVHQGETVVPAAMIDPRQLLSQALTQVPRAANFMLGMAKGLPETIMRDLPQQQTVPIPGMARQQREAEAEKARQVAAFKRNFPRLTSALSKVQQAAESAQTPRGRAQELGAQTMSRLMPKVYGTGRGAAILGKGMEAVDIAELLANIPRIAGAF